MVALKAKTAFDAIRLAHFQDKLFFLKKWLPKLPEKDKKFLTGYAWICSEFPSVFAKDEWLETFKEVGFFTWGLKEEDIEFPEDYIVLYRGCIPEYKDGMSWSDDVRTALFFQIRGNESNKKNIYKATVPKNAVLGIIKEGGSWPFQHVYKEYVVDCRQVDSIEEYDDSLFRTIADLFKKECTIDAEYRKHLVKTLLDL